MEVTSCSVIAGGGGPWMSVERTYIGAPLHQSTVYSATLIKTIFLRAIHVDAMSCVEWRPAAEPLPSPGARLANLGIRLTLNRCTISMP